MATFINTTHDREIQLIKAGFKLVARFITLYSIKNPPDKNNYYFAMQDICEELEEIINKL